VEIQRIFIFIYRPNIPQNKIIQLLLNHWAVLVTTKNKHHQMMENTLTQAILEEHNLPFQIYNSSYTPTSKSSPCYKTLYMTWCPYVTTFPPDIVRENNQLLVVSWSVCNYGSEFYATWPYVLSNKTDWLAIWMLYPLLVGFTTHRKQPITYSLWLP